MPPKKAQPQDAEIEKSQEPYKPEKRKASKSKSPQTKKLNKTSEIVEETKKEVPKGKQILS